MSSTITLEPQFMRQLLLLLLTVLPWLASPQGPQSAPLESLSVGLAAAPPASAAERATEGAGPATPAKGNADPQGAVRKDFATHLELATFEDFAGQFPGVRAIKLIVDRKPENDSSLQPRVYFLNSKVYDLHINFLRQNRLITKEQVKNVQLDSWRSEERRFVFVQLARYDEAPQQYVLELFDEDKASAKLISSIYPAIQKEVAFGPLAFKPNSMEQESRRAELTRLGVPMLANDALSVNRLYQVIHAGRPAVGRLRVVSETDSAVVDTMVFNRNEIIVLQTIPNDITRVAGIITTRPTTPLSHVALRARSWDIPTILMRDALNLIYREGLEDAWVRLEVPAEGHATLRRATEAEVQEAEKARAASLPQFRVPRADLTYSQLPALTELRSSDVVRVGAKAANLGELTYLHRHLEQPELAPVLAALQGNWLQSVLSPLPRRPARLSAERRAKAYLGRLHIPSGFAIPFAAYQAFLELPANARVKESLESTLAEPRFGQDAVYRKQRLEALQEQLRGAQFPPEWGRRILERIHRELPDRRLFVRSSTNSEDLDGFNGAGLYETVGNVEGDEAVLTAIKRVWASVWNFKAYEARVDAGIQHRAVYPGVLIQEAVKPFAAGVLITKDVLDQNGPYRFYLNANPGLGENTVNTGRGLPEQIYGDPATGEIKRISLSERGGELLTDAEVRELVFYSALVERHFGSLAGRFPYPQDIEFLIFNGRIAIVQTRPYLEKRR